MEVWRCGYGGWFCLEIMVVVVVVVVDGDFGRGVGEKGGKKGGRVEGVAGWWDGGGYG